MAIYEYYCPTCREGFERRRPMSEAATEVRCNQGHRAERTLSAFAVTRTGGAMTQVAEMPAGGCCGGGGCACSN
jgi:putative FmdB family regulatory protein